MAGTRRQFSENFAYAGLEFVAGLDGGELPFDRRGLEVALMRPGGDLVMGLFDIAKSARPERLSDVGRRTRLSAA